MMPVSTTVYMRSDPYKVGWVVGLYGCETETGLYEAVYRQLGASACRDFHKGVRDGSSLRRSGPKYEVFAIDQPRPLTTLDREAELIGIS